MIVVDASLVIEVLIGGTAGEKVSDRLIQEGSALAAPELLDLEVLQVLRRLAASGRLSPANAEAALAILSDLNIERFSHAGFTGRIWELRENLTAYDGAYIALAEALDVPFWTRDAKLMSVPGVTVPVHVL